MWFKNNESKERLIQIETQILCILLFHAAEFKNFVTRQHYTHSLPLRKYNRQVSRAQVKEER